jgi:hypothetical protein
MNGQHGTILFYSEASDPSWPTELEKAFPTFAIRTRPEDTDPGDVVAAIVWKYPAGMLPMRRRNCGQARRAP